MATPPSKEELLRTFDGVWDDVENSDGSNDTPGEGFVRMMQSALPYYGITQTDDEICICLALGAVWADAVAADAADDMFRQMRDYMDAF